MAVDELDGLLLVPCLFVKANQYGKHKLDMKSSCSRMTWNPKETKCNDDDDDDDDDNSSLQLSGRALEAQLAQTWIRLPVLALLAFDEEEDRVSGVDAMDVGCERVEAVLAQQLLEVAAVTVILAENVARHHQD